MGLEFILAATYIPVYHELKEVLVYGAEEAYAPVPSKTT